MGIISRIMGFNFCNHNFSTKNIKFSFLCEIMHRQIVTNQRLNNNLIIKKYI
jgi:hypothetical protein